MAPEFVQMELDLEIADRIIAAALQEDLAYGPDVTTRATVGPDERSIAVIRAREAGTIAGVELMTRVLAQVSTGDFRITPRVRDGARVEPGDVVLFIDALTRDLLTAEQTMLNLLTHMSGIATATAVWVDAVAGSGARIRDSRSTLPGLRMLQKYSVRVGGGFNHRLGLGDRAMVKVHHAAAVGGLVPALRAVRAKAPQKWCEVDVHNLEQLDEVLREHPEEIKLESFELWQTQTAVQRRNALSVNTMLESGGRLSLTEAVDLANCGVDFIAVEALTRSVTALDLVLEIHS
ncbi:carboxylating nicotinate-nucleotide diphosphorylase [Corynebacterium sp. A21]|uniref:carboxylating nicotinate-nucleotide diphosphorylase n=1 Tax=Corynebacterium sp. A21 TaxID=3457318 RepID=UPI003FD4B742